MIPLKNMSSTSWTLAFASTIDSGLNHFKLKIATKDLNVIRCTGSILSKTCWSKTGITEKM